MRREAILVIDYKLPNKRRLEAVFKHLIPDRVPNFEVLVDNPVLYHIMGRSIKGRNIYGIEQDNTHTLGNIDPVDYIEFVTKTGQDAIGMCFYDRPFKYIDQKGQKKNLDFFIKSREDLDKLLPINMDHLEEGFQLLDRYQEAVKNTDIGLFVLLGDFFCDCYDRIFGFDNFMYLIYDDLGLIEEVLERYSIHYQLMAERLLQYDLTFFYVGDDIAYKSGTLINPELMRRIWVPRINRVFSAAKEKGVPILFHSDGDITDMIPDLLEMGVDAINPVESNCMDIRLIKKQYGRDLTLVGGVDVGSVLSLGTVEEVKSAVEQLIDDAGKDGGLVVASSHSITSNVRLENFLTMIETTQTYGIY